jgi:hypothetical protein
MRRFSSVLGAVTTAFAATLWLSVPSSAAGLTTEMVSVSSAGTQGNGDSFPEAESISPDGRFVVFDSFASSLVSGDTNAGADVFRHDRSTGQTIRVSVSSSSEEGNGDSFNGAISSDGHLVAFDSGASNLVAGDTNKNADVFLRDVSAGTTTRVSLTSSGKQANADSFAPVLSDDGRLVVFSSDARLAPEDTNRRVDVYVRDLLTGQIRLVSVSSTGQPGNDDSFVEGPPSADDRFVAFASFASNLVSGDTNDALDVFLHDLLTGVTTRLSLSSSDQQGDADSFGSKLSANGRFVAFTSFADNLVRHDANGFADAFVRDLKTGRTTLVSKSSTGDQGNDDSFSSKGISGDGRFVAYRSFASNLVPGDTNGGADVFLFDRSTGQTVLVSVSATGEQGVYPFADGSYNVGISENGAWVLFGSIATNFVPGGDTNGDENGDTFVRGPFGTTTDPALTSEGSARTGSAAVATSSDRTAAGCRDVHRC